MVIVVILLEVKRGGRDASRPEGRKGEESSAKE